MANDTLKPQVHVIALLRSLVVKGKAWVYVNGSHPKSEMVSSLGFKRSFKIYLLSLTEYAALFYKQKALILRTAPSVGAFLFLPLLDLVYLLFLLFYVFYCNLFYILLLYKALWIALVYEKCNTNKAALPWTIERWTIICN